MHTEAKLVWSTCGCGCMACGKSAGLISGVETTHAYKTWVYKYQFDDFLLFPCCIVLTIIRIIVAVILALLNQQNMELSYCWFWSIDTIASYCIWKFICLSPTFLLYFSIWTNCEVFIWVNKWVNRVYRPSQVT